MEERKRRKLNTWLFIVIYALMGILSGVALDAMVTFLDASPATKQVAASMSVLMGVGFVGGAGLLLLIPRTGYKRVLALGPVAIGAGLYLVTSVSSIPMVFLSASLVMIGVCFFDAILPPFLSCYTLEDERPKVFSTSIWTNILGMVVGTWMGGRLIASRFAARLGLSYGDARTLTEDIGSFTPIQLNQYIGAHKDVLLMYIIVAAVSFIPIFMIREHIRDYAREGSAKRREKIQWKALSDRYIIFFLVFVALIRMGACLITPYFPVFLSRMGIDRATTSSLVSYQYFAMVIFVAASPWIVKRVGRVMALGGLALVSIPFMMLIANGAAFGAYKVLAVGVGLFLRSGFMNASQPVQQSLPMEFVGKELRPAYSSIIFIVQGAAQFIAGGLGMRFLFTRPDGYTLAYYVTGLIYIVASVMILLVFYRRYNRPYEEIRTQKSGSIA